MTKQIQNHPNLLNNIYSLLKLNADRHSQNTYLLSSENQFLTYFDLFNLVQKNATHLANSGFGRNDLVAIVMPNCPEFATCFLSVTAASICAPLNPDLKINNYDLYFKDLKPKLAIVPHLNHDAAIAARNLGICLGYIEADASVGAFKFVLECAGSPLPMLPPEGSDLALVLYTTGTTAHPKQVALSHQNLVSSAQNVSQTLRMTENDRCINAMPLFHMHGIMASILTPLVSSSSVYFMKKFEAHSFLNTIKQLKITWYSAIPTIHQLILNAIRSDLTFLNSLKGKLRFVRSSSAPMPPSLISEFENLTGIPFIESLGMTEASMQICSNPLPPEIRKPGSVGPPKGPDLKIVDDKGNERPKNETGEVLIRGPSVVTTYQNNPAATKASFDNGWLRTGDLGFLDSDGYLFLVGRVKEMINKGGEKIAPREVEESLLTHPSVQEAVCFSIPHPFLGEDVCAAVKLGPDTLPSSEELRHYLIDILPDFKVPARILILDELPKNAVGKLQRIGLAKQLAQLLEPEKGGSDKCSTPTETSVQKMWKDLLNLPKINLNENFFSLGGHSLLATQLSHKIENEFSIVVTAQTIFRFPTIAQLSKQIDLKISSGKPLAIWTRPIRASRNKNQFPISPSQERLWFLEKLNPNSTTYSVPFSFILNGDVKPENIRLALDRITSRHEILRTRIFESEDSPFQYIESAQSYQLDFLFFELNQNLNIERNEKQLVETLVKKHASIPFKLEQGNLFRIRLWQLSHEKFLLFLNLHHLICDNTSIGILFAELGAEYRAVTKEKNTDLHEPEMQFLDFAEWQKLNLNRENAEYQRQISYWKTTLMGAPDLISLPTDRVRPAAVSNKGARMSFRIPSSLAIAVCKLSKESNCSIFTSLLTCFKIQLSKYSGTTDLVIGAAIASRGQREFENTFGFLLNTIPIRTTIPEHISFRDAVKATQASAISAFENQDVPLEHIIENLNLSRSTSHSPLFQVAFFFRNTSLASFTLESIKTTPLEVDRGTSMFDLTLSIAEDSEGFECYFEYSSDLFDRATIERMVNHLKQILAEVTHNSNIQISKIDPLDDKERKQILVSFNETDHIFSESTLVHCAFEKSVETFPDAIALSMSGLKMTYQELNRRANQLAHGLLKLGVGPKTLVAVHLDRSFEMLIALYGILKCGATYVPVDVSYPISRRDFMIQDSGAKIALTTSEYSELRKSFNGKLITLDTEDGKFSKEADTNPNVAMNPDDPIYVIYTSGSTGNPKGVINTHRGVLNQLYDFRRILNLTPGDAVLLKTAFSFDVSVWELFGTLVSGCRLEILAPGIQNDPIAVADVIESNKVNTVIFVPSMLQSFLEVGGASVCSQLKQVICIGEALSSELQNRFFSMSKSDLYNFYGPTEAAVACTVWKCKRDGTNRIVPIGRPMANNSVYILDPSGSPVPIGAIGEIYIGGLQVAKGYLNRIELTAEKFVVDPYKKPELGQNSKMYRTGDLGRFLPSGDIEFLGRKDNQVKVRGFRIELGEIEAALVETPMVVGAVVITEIRSDGDTGLIAFIQSEKNHELNVEELRLSLSSKIPEYMIPQKFKLVSQIPLSPSGKADRKALATMNSQVIGSSQEFELPLPGIETELANIWQELLNIKAVGRNDDFFSIGGYSILAIRMFSKINKSFQVRLPIRTIFQARTLQALTLKIKEMKSDSEKSLETVTPLDLLSKVSLSSDIEFKVQNQNFSSNPQIFFTGSNGFLGIHLLAELLNKSNSKIYCLIRARSNEEASKRIYSTLKEYNLYSKVFEKRIVGIAGDVEKPHFGLSDFQYLELSNSADCVIHGAARVNHIYPLEELWQTNIVGTSEILRFASIGKEKKIHYVSSVGVGALDENSPLTHQRPLKNGYAQSKWISEMLVQEAISRGAHASIYRPGFLTWNSETGAVNQNQLDALLIMAIMETRKFPPNAFLENLISNFTPVNCAASAIATLILPPSRQNSTFHIINSFSANWSEVVDHMKNDFEQLEEVSLQTWIKALENATLHSTTCANLLALISEQDLVSKFKSNISCQSTEKTLNSKSFFWQQAEPSIFRCLEFLKSVNNKKMAA